MAGPKFQCSHLEQAVNSPLKLGQRKACLCESKIFSQLLVFDPQTQSLLFFWLHIDQCHFIILSLANKPLFWSYIYAFDWWFYAKQLTVQYIGFMHWESVKRSKANRAKNTLWSLGVTTTFICSSKSPELSFYVCTEHNSLPNLQWLTLWWS